MTGDGRLFIDMEKFPIYNVTKQLHKTLNMTRRDSMKFSIMREKITPDIPVKQAGYAARDHKSIGVHDDTYASVALMEANETVVIIALDVCYGDKRFTYGIKETINKKYGLTQDKIIISYTHTHSAVGITGEEIATPDFEDTSKPGNDESKENPGHGEAIRYYHIVKDKIMAMLEEEFKNLIEGDVYICRGRSKFGVSRRYPSAEGILWRPYYGEDSMDDDLLLLKFVDRNKKIHGLIYNYACHPTTLGSDNYYISADYPGVVRKLLEEKNKGMTAIFLQGCGADIKPYITAGDAKFKNCTYEELEHAGTSLANDIQACIEKSEWRKIDAEFKTGFSEVKLYTEVWDEVKWMTVLNDPDEPEYRKRAVREKLEHMKTAKAKNYLPYYMSFLRLDDKTCLVCLECEVVSDIGKEIKRLFNEDVIVLGYSNSIACYIPTKKVLQQGGYERDSFMSARLAGPFVPEIEDIIVGRAALMVKS